MLARIHSRLANWNSNLDLGHTCAIVVLTGLITFLGFIGTDRILDALATSGPASQAIPPASAASGAAIVHSSGSATPLPVANPLARKATFDFWFNFGVLLLFVASLLNLIFRWKDRYTAHFSGVVKLRQFIGWLDEISVLDSNPIDAGKLKYIRHKYESIVELLPPNSDEDYLRAKKEAGEKSNAPATSGRTGASAQLDDEQFVHKLVRSSPATMELLAAAAGVSATLWLGGGSIRTLAWNYLTGRSEDVHDYDVVYFDATNLRETEEKRLETELRKQLPRTIRISVKNQARMHLVNGEPRRDSLEDAISSWPEMATAHALRLGPLNRFVAIAPYGYGDVLDLIVQPTPYHAKNPAAFTRRLASKEWKKHWPELEIRKPNNS